MAKTNIFLPILSLLLPASLAMAQRDLQYERDAHRVALVIGNNAYPKAPLRNAVNDARGMGQTLKDLGFDVEVVVDANAKDMDAAVNRLASKLGQGDVALFYYAGHGVQIEGENYLIPTDFQGGDEADVKYKTQSASWVQGKLDKTGAQLKIMVLDACRTNPFRVSRGPGGGLAQMQGGRGTFIAFATAAGKVANDNVQDNNGLFTKHLMQVLRQPGLPLDEVFNRVRANVDRESGGEQLPYVYSGVIGQFYFRAPNRPVTTDTGAGSPTARPVDFNAYCVRHGFTGAINIDGTGNGWKCAPANAAIDASLSCREQYGNSWSATLLSAAPGRINDWRCVNAANATSGNTSAVPSIRVTSAEICRTGIPGSVNAANLPPPETEFLTTDYWAALQFTYTGGVKGGKIHLEFVNPLGATALERTFEQGGNGGSWAWFQVLWIAGQPPSFTPGNWHARVFYAGQGVIDLPFRISAPPPSPVSLVSSTLLPQGTAGAPYSYKLTARGGKAPYRWSGTDLPGGVTLSSSGVLSGTPAERGSYPFTVRVLDGSKNEIVRKVALGVGPAPVAKPATVVLDRSQADPDACAARPNVAEFRKADERAWIAFTLDSAKPNESGTVEWLNPTGDVVQSASVKFKSGATECLTAALPIAGAKAAGMPGDWRVRLLWQSGEVFSVPFRIQNK